MSATSNPAVIQPISSSLSQLLFLFLINAFTVAPKMRAPAIIDNIIFFLLLLLFQREVSFFIYFQRPPKNAQNNSVIRVIVTLNIFILSLFSCYRHHCLLCFHIRKILKIMGVCFYFSLIFNQLRFLESGSLRILDFITSLSFYSLPYTQDSEKYGSAILFSFNFQSAPENLFPVSLHIIYFRGCAKNLHTK